MPFSQTEHIPAKQSMRPFSAFDMLLVVFIVVAILGTALFVSTSGAGLTV